MSANVVSIGAAVPARGSRSDGERVALLRAERELQLLAVILEYAELSPVALLRASTALRSIGVALALARPVLGMALRSVDDAGLRSHEK